jgi:hypothetical protein
MLVDDPVRRPAESRTCLNHSLSQRYCLSHIEPIAGARSHQA